MCVFYGGKRKKYRQDYEDELIDLNYYYWFCGLSYHHYTKLAYKKALVSPNAQSSIFLIIGSDITI